jgi:hypothetical protein
MAITVIGGLITSTLLTLVLVPALYTILDDMRTLTGRILRFILRPLRSTAAPTPPPTVPPAGPPTGPSLEKKPSVDGQPRLPERVPAGVAGGSE